MVASRASLIGGLALVMGVCALVAKAPGAWGCAASWATLSIALMLWENASRSAGLVRSVSKTGQDAYAQGLTVPEEDPSEKIAKRLNFKSGALLALAAMVAFMGATMCALGSFAISLGWGMLACVPLVWVASDAIKAASKEDHDESMIRGKGRRHVP